MSPSSGALWFLSAVLAVPIPAAERTFEFHKRVSEVQLTVVAEDASGRPLQSLSAGDIVVRDRGETVNSFSLQPAKDLPLRVGIVLDLSASTAVTWGQIRAALISSVQNLVEPADEVMVVTFDRKIELLETLHQPTDLQRLLPIRDTGSLTALYDSVYRTCDTRAFFDSAGPRHLALILFSDGEDNLSLRGLKDAIARAQASGIAIYTIAMHKRKVIKSGDAVLEEMALTTGGRAFVVRDRLELQAALGTINSELRNAYLLSFRPIDDSGGPSFHPVEVVPAPGVQVRVRAKAGYYTTP